MNDKISLISRKNSRQRLLNNKEAALKLIQAMHLNNQDNQSKIEEETAIKIKKDNFQIQRQMICSNKHLGAGRSTVESLLMRESPTPTHGNTLSDNDEREAQYLTSSRQ
jgi:hypothetical protein